MKKRILILLAAFALCLAITACFGQHEFSSEGELSEGDKMRDFTGELVSGGEFSLSDHKGEVILLNFWATWCGPCVGEMPAFPKLVEKYGDELCLVAVNCAEDKETVQSFLDSNGYMFDVVLDPDYEISDLYPTDGIPYTLIIDRDGNIAHIQLGADSADIMYDAYAEIIDGLI